MLITIAAASGPQIRRITELCEAAGIEVKTVPALAEHITGAGGQTRLGTDVARVDTPEHEEVVDDGPLFF